MRHNLHAGIIHQYVKKTCIKARPGRRPNPTRSCRNSMVPTSSLALLVTLVALSPVVRTSPLLPHQDAITPLTPAEIAAFKPYTWYAAMVACNLSAIMDWSCGEKCNANPTFKPLATGGDGDLTQFCMPFLGALGIPDVTDPLRNRVRRLRSDPQHCHCCSPRYRRL